MKYLLPILLMLSLLIIFSCGDDDDDDDSNGHQTDDDIVGDDDDDDDDHVDDDDDDYQDDDDDTTGPDPIDDGAFTDDSTPFVSTLQDRIDSFMADCAADGLSRGALHCQVCVLATNAGNARDDAIDAALAKMDARLDCADFRLASLVRIMAKYSGNPGLSQDQYDRIFAGMQNFKYWSDEPGTDAMYYWTENHSILFHSAAFAIGAMYPDTVFTNSGLTGLEIRAKARHYLDLWLEFRLRFGFTEFHSNVYYNETIPGLVNISDFGQDPVLAEKARMVLDIMLYDMALNNHEGVFGVSHGRSYMKDKQRLETEDTKTTMWLAFGKGDPFGNWDNMSAVALADSHTYTIPPVIESIGSSRPRGLVSKELTSIKVEDGPALGYDYDNFDDGFTWWTMSALVIPETVELTMDMLDEWRLLAPPSPFAALALLAPLADTGLLPFLIELLEPVVTGTLLEQANTYVYRTPEVMLASAQDWRPAVLGTQSHLWQATLGWNALVFATYPGGLIDDSAAGQWTGGWHPRIAQHRSAAIMLFRKPELEVPFIMTVLDLIFPDHTHAYFPKDDFDEVQDQGGWTFGRFGDGYIALYSHNPTEWITQGEWADKELRADGAENVWICEVGDATMYGTYENFKSLILAANVDIGPDLDVKYISPGQGKMEFSWEGDFYLRGVQTDITGYPRFESPYSLKQFDGNDTYYIERGDHALELDVTNNTRTIIDLSE